MRKVHLPLAALMLPLALSAATPGASAIVGADAAACAANKSALLVRVVGLKQSTGTLKLALYGANQAMYLKKQGRLQRLKVAVPSAGPVDVCIAVPGPGRYAVAIHHDLNGNGDKDRHDGGGYSNNPRLSITNMRPAFARTAVVVGAQPTRITVIMLYVKGLSVGPAAS